MTLAKARLEARQRLHERLAIEAIPYPGGDLSSPGDTVSLRLHTETTEGGGLAGGGEGFSEYFHVSPRLLFWAEDHVPARGTVYAVRGVAAFRVENLQPRTGPVVYALATRLPRNQGDRYFPDDRIPDNALTWKGEPLTWRGEILTWR